MLLIFVCQVLNCLYLFIFILLAQNFKLLSWLYL